MEDKSCISETKNLTESYSLDYPCKENAKATVCPEAGTKNVTVFTCNCDRKNLCNVSTNIQPSGIWNMAVGVVGAFLALKIIY